MSGNVNVLEHTCFCECMQAPPQVLSLLPIAPLNLQPLSLEVTAQQPLTLSMAPAVPSAPLTAAAGVSTTWRLPVSAVLQLPHTAGALQPDTAPSQAAGTAGRRLPTAHSNPWSDISVALLRPGGSKLAHSAHRSHIAHIVLHLWFAGEPLDFERACKLLRYLDSLEATRRGRR